MQVVALIHETDGAYSASFPDFPGCTARAMDIDELLVGAAAALVKHVDILVENDREWPQVRSLSRLANDPTFLASSTGAMIALVPLTPGTRAVRLAITFDQSLLAEIDRAAQAAEQSRSDYLAEAARRRLAHDGEEAPRGARWPAARSNESSHNELSTPETGTPVDAQASLKRIREILERLDRPSAATEHIAPLRPAKRTQL
jgi:predicted RNase H-like HicB family nuclease